MILVFLTCLLTQAPKPEPAAVNAPKLRDELQARVKEDQAARFAMIDFMAKHQTGAKSADGRTAVNLSPEQNKELQTLIKRVKEADDKNTAWLTEVVDEHGWPGKSLIGEAAAHDAWLLVQHADAHKDFQDECLQKMKAAPAGEVAPRDVAYLTDRTLTNRGKKQIYGTQTRLENGKAVPFPIEDEANVDQKRKECGMQPLAEYLKQVEETYVKPKP
ncbi:MAG: hypothetical protein P4L85_08905 [Paludisphaera borealis]|uniref:DUF6624 domain-containing protein n=1 Tax=Paludisphaera borealis TaxID=1387353 RepID=UPI0028484007|nr:DUF6624 domain-containing protein [Paludisphaera borealis]MDR3619456.1 hypothetical protein [Paludisphaera borealis]